MTDPDPVVQPDLSVQLGKVRLPNPVLTASGTCGYAWELAPFVDLGRIGGFITKSITVEPRAGNRPQRTFETAAGMLNSIGLANVGLRKFLSDKVPLLERMRVPVFVNVAGRTVEDYVEVAREVSQVGCVAGLELNISCPNVKEGGITFGTDPVQIERLVAAVREACPGVLLIVKLTPNVTDIAVTARAAVSCGADVLSLVNTFTGMAVDISRRRKVLGGGTGGLSGPAIKPLALHLVHRVYTQVAREAAVPVIGMGGILTAGDAIEFLLAGASAVSVGTAVLCAPRCLTEIVDGISAYLRGQGEASVAGIVGTLQ